MGRMKDKWIDENPMQLTPGDCVGEARYDAREELSSRRVELMRKARELPSWEHFAQKLKEYPYTGKDGKLNLDACFGLLCSFCETCNVLAYPFYRLVYDLNGEIERLDGHLAERDAKIEAMARDLTITTKAKAKFSTAITKRPGRPKANRG